MTKSSFDAVKRVDFSEMTMTDDCTGIPSGELPRHFEPFNRSDRSRSQETGWCDLEHFIIRLKTTLRIKGLG